MITLYFNDDDDVGCSLGKESLVREAGDFFKTLEFFIVPLLSDVYPESLLKIYIETQFIN